MLRNLIGLGFVGVFAAVGFFGWRTATEQQRALAEKDAEIRERERQIAEQHEALSRLTRSRRVAQAVVVERWTDENTGKVLSKVRFVEVDDAGKPIATSRETIVEGEVVHFDALVLKFEPELVAAGDPAKGRSVLLFRRMYGEHGTPSQGTPLDESEQDAIPSVYRSRGSVTDGERELWGRFWQLANNPELAKKEGVRIAQGEAVYTRMEPEMIYNLELDASGGLNIRATRVPAVLLPSEH